MPNVSLSDILEALESASNELTSYVDPATGKVVTLFREDFAALDAAEEGKDISPWQEQQLARLRDLDLDKLLILPGKYEIHEWEIVKRFSLSQEHEGHREALLDAIHGAGAFRSFRRELERLGLLDAWYAYRSAAFKRIAIEWAEDHGLSLGR